METIQNVQIKVAPLTQEIKDTVKERKERFQYARIYYLKFAIQRHIS